ncbi:uncharacterized protein LOC111390948 isoform X6 [Olea europaea var. sylvestris]|uniref:uncharacterized protein LOC111390948 isoform X6 n=1 Tax=Olea europaea var. sylvestris TaxID=158386 RepID=UPI000C1D755F|nr:uncharacterized protein LOC111390948 isoform X6 [Olea europaea var. sylvestris]
MVIQFHGQIQGLKECEANLVVYLHPSMAKCVNDAILRELSSLLFTFDEEILHISGSLVTANTGCARWLDTNLEEWSQADSTTRKRKDRDEKEQKTADDKLMASRDIPPLKKADRIKKLKKKKRKEHT